MYCIVIFYLYLSACRCDVIALASKATPQPKGHCEEEGAWREGWREGGVERGVARAALRSCEIAPGELYFAIMNN